MDNPDTGNIRHTRHRTKTNINTRHRTKTNINTTQHREWTI